MTDNGNAAPVIPSGTEKTVFGGNTFPGQAAPTPGANNPPAGVNQPASPENAVPASAGTITFEKLAQLKGFKSADDLANSYVNLEQGKTRSDMALSDLLNIRQESGQQPTATPTVSDPNNMSTEDAVKVLEGVVKKFTQPLEDKMELNNLFSIYPDAKQFAAEMGKIVKANPGVSWEVAYKAAKHDTVVKQTTDNGRREANIQVKENLQVTPPRASVNNTRNLKEIIADRSIPFHEVQKIMRENLGQR